MKRILILGKTGMLGSMIYYHFSKCEDYAVFSTSREESKGNNLFFDTIKNDISVLSDFINENKVEFIINAIGVIKPYCKDDDVEGVRKAILVNAYFPHKLSVMAKDSEAKIIQIATDCVYSGKEGGYRENSLHDALDVYGKTKSLGEVNDGSMLNIRCSIIGPEIKGKLSLLEWFLSQQPNSEIKGFTHHKWNGITTLRFAKLIEQIISKNLYKELIKNSSVYHFVPGYVLNKWDMLEIFNNIFNKQLKITPINNVGPNIDRSLSTEFDNLKHFSNIDFEKDVDELKETMDNDFYTYQQRQ